MLSNYSVSYNVYADDTKIYFKLGSKEQCVSKLITVLNDIQTWMFKRKLKFIKDKTSIIIVGYPLQTKNIDLPSSLKLEQSDLKLSKKMRNLGVDLHKIFTLKYQTAAVEKKIFVGLINIPNISKLIDRESRLKLMYCLVQTQIDICITLLYGQQNTDLRGLQIILNAVE